jgi:hypothetical protein
VLRRAKKIWVGVIIHKKLPEEGCWRMRHEVEMYRLLPRKKLMYEFNRTFKQGIRYLIYSRYARVWYQRELDSEATTEEDISYFMEVKLLWLFPTEEYKEEIREDVEKAGIGYFQLMARRQAEMDWERLSQEKNDGNGFHWRMKVLKEEKNKYRKK